MSKIDLHGILPPITTPFINGKVAYDELAANIEKWNKTGLIGYVVLGSNGEYVYLSTEASGLSKDGVVNIAQLVTVHRKFLSEPVGRVGGRLLREVDEGLRLVLAI